MGGGTKLKADASTSGAHSATQCNHIHTYQCSDWSTADCDSGYTCPGGTREECSGGTTEECSGGSVGDCEPSTSYGVDETITCKTCGNHLGYHYTFVCDTCHETVRDRVWGAWRCDHTSVSNYDRSGSHDMSKHIEIKEFTKPCSICGSLVEHYTQEWCVDCGACLTEHFYSPAHKCEATGTPDGIREECEVDQSWDHNQTENECEHGEMGSHSVDEECSHGEMDSHYYNETPCEHGEFYEGHSKECEHGYTRSHTYRVACSHGYTDTHSQSDPYSCSSTYPCQNGHSSYRTVNHYYCTTHGYLGTSSTCPGLTINPYPSSITVHVGESYKITPNQKPSEASVNYKSNNTGIASVSSTGKVTGKKKGNTTITVTGVLS